MNKQPNKYLPGKQIVLEDFIGGISFLIWKSMTSMLHDLHYKIVKIIQENHKYVIEHFNYVHYSY